MGDHPSCGAKLCGYFQLCGGLLLSNLAFPVSKTLAVLRRLALLMHPWLWNNCEMLSVRTYP